MKNTLAFLALSAFLGTSAFAADCIDLSGKFKVTETVSDGEVEKVEDALLEIVQTDCEKVKVTGTLGEDEEPSLIFGELVANGKPQLAMEIEDVGIAIYIAYNISETALTGDLYIKSKDGEMTRAKDTQVIYALTTEGDLEITCIIADEDGGTPKKNVVRTKRVQ